MNNIDLAKFLQEYIAQQPKPAAPRTNPAELSNQFGKFAHSFEQEHPTKKGKGGAKKKGDDVPRPSSTYGAVRKVVVMRGEAKVNRPLTSETKELALAQANLFFNHFQMGTEAQLFESMSREGCPVWPQLAKEGAVYEFGLQIGKSVKFESIFKSWSLVPYPSLQMLDTIPANSTLYIFVFTPPGTQ